KDNDISARRQAAEKAKQRMIDGFRAKAQDPATAQRKEERLAAAQAKALRIEERKAAEAAAAARRAVEEKARQEAAAKLAAEQAEQAAIERRAEGDRAIALL